MTMGADPIIKPCGDTALLVVFAESLERAVLDRVTALDRALLAHPPAGLVETVPSFGTLLVCYDPLIGRGGEIEAHIADLLAHPHDDVSAPGRHWEVPVCYDPDLAPDLAELACKAGLSPEAFAARHAATSYDVLVTGSFPGYAYCGTLDKGLRFPRRTTPRTTIPAGAVAIANEFTCVYPVASPGGWNLIGQSPVRLFDPERDPPALFAVGDTIRYVAVTRAELDTLDADAAAGRWSLRPAA